MTANVTFYLIAILALSVVQSRHSLQETNHTNVPGNVLIVDHHVKKKLYIYSLGQLEGI